MSWMKQKREKISDKFQMNRHTNYLRFKFNFIDHKLHRFNGDANAFLSKPKKTCLHVDSSMYSLLGYQQNIKPSIAVSSFESIYRGAYVW